MSAANGNGHPVREISLLGALGEEWIKLPFTAMRDVGPAVQTLGGLLAITTGETFVPVGEIARKARVPERTAKAHLLTLHDHGWIDNRGRERTRRGNPRRTCTIRLAAKAKAAAADGWGILPWWTCFKWRPPFNWSAKAVLSVLMGRLCAMKAAADRGEGCVDGAGDEEDMLGALENMDVDGHFRGLSSLRKLEEITGLDRKSIAVAKRRLHTIGCIIWQRSGDTTPRGTVADLLIPNWDFRVAITDLPNGRCTARFCKKPTTCGG